MKHNKLKWLIAMLSLLLLLQGCIHPGPSGDDTSGAQTTDPGALTTPPKHYYKDMVYTYRTAVEGETLLTELNQAYLLLANKTNPLGQDYAPTNLTLLTCPINGDKEIYLEKRAAEALYAMLAEMRACGVTDALVTSAYRSYEYQVWLNNYYHQVESQGFSQDAYACLGEDYIQRYYKDAGLTSLSPEDVERVVRSYSAEPGKSEHQTGLCVDLVTEANPKLNVEFEKTPAFAWLSENAYKFGFILRYPKGEEPITGYTYEPWHYRFVGREAATDIHFGELTLEEYLDWLAGGENG